MRLLNHLANSLIACIILTGCTEQSTRVPVSGSVFIDGQPLTAGTIRFVPATGRPVTSAIMSDGSFQLSENLISAPLEDSGVVPGVYRVAVSAPEILSESAEEVRWHAPSKYADFRTSELEVTIEGPETDLQIELTWEGNDQGEEENSSEESVDDDAEATSENLVETDQEALSEE